MRRFLLDQLKCHIEHLLPPTVANQVPPGNPKEELLISSAVNGRLLQSWRFHFLPVMSFQITRSVLLDHSQAPLMGTLFLTVVKQIPPGTSQAGCEACCFPAPALPPSPATGIHRNLPVNMKIQQNHCSSQALIGFSSTMNLSSPLLKLPKSVAIATFWDSKWIMPCRFPWRTHW